MDCQTESQVLIKIGQLEGKIDGIDKKQNEMCRELSALRNDIIGVKIKAAGFGTILGGLAGYFSKLIT